jgi:hypothetical protein
MRPKRYHEEAIGKVAGQSGGGRAPDGAAKAHASKASPLKRTPKIAMKNRVLFAIRLGRWCLFSAGCDDF